MDLSPHLQRLSLFDKGHDDIHHSKISPDADYFSTLPTEILEIIFSYLSPKSLTQEVLPVCRRFRQFLSDKKWWIRQIRDHPLKIHLCDTELKNAEFNPARTFHVITREERIRKNWKQRERSWAVTCDWTIDDVKLFRKSGERFCVSASSSSEKQPTHVALWNMGSRTEPYRRMRLLDLVRINYEADLCAIEICGTESFLTSTNGNVRLWDIGESGLRERCKKSFDHPMLMRYLSHHEGMVACSGKYTTKIALLDVKNGLQEIARNFGIRALDGPSCSFIQSVTLQGNTIYVLLSAHLLTVDVRNLTSPVLQHSFGDLSASYEYDINAFGGKHVYKSMSVADGLIHCSHTGGKISVLQASDLTPCYSFYVSEYLEERRDLRSVVKSEGSILTCGRRSLRAFSPGTQPVCLGAYYDQYKFAQEPVFDALHGDVIVGGRGRLTYWPSD